MSTTRGKIVSVESSGLVIQNEAGVHRVKADPQSARLGDWVEISGGKTRVLTANRAQGAQTWMERTLNPRRLRGTEVRSKVERGIREFFAGQGFREVRTPLLVPSPGMEPHIRPMRAGTWADGKHAAVPFLPTSPEFAMKRLLAGGLEKIFQICPAFRSEPPSATHHPEFTILEWYRSYASYDDIQRDTEELFAHVARAVHGEPRIPYQGRMIDVAPPWPRLRIRDLYRDHLGIDLARADAAALAAECRKHGLSADAGEGWDDLYFKLWLNLIEPKLPADRAVFVTRYPASQAALSVVDADPDGSRWARRFEAYAGGLELANAFEELTDPVEQRRRFTKDMELRTQLYGPSFPPSPIDEGFLRALEEGMPPAGGIALGVDRLVMLMADEADIRYTLWLESFWGLEDG